MLVATFLVQRIRRPSTCYMETVQKDVNQIMRSILVDWLVEVALEYKLVSDTFFLAVNYIDRFLSTNNVARQKLQLVGVTCMLLASKYEEIYAPQIDDFCYITDGTYTRCELLSSVEVKGAVQHHALSFTFSSSTAYCRCLLAIGHSSFRGCP